MTKKHYQTLGVDENATQDDIKKAYREKAKELHPDKNGGDDLGFAELNRANEVLSDPDRRKRYDETGDDGKLSIEEEITQAIKALAMMFIDTTDDVKTTSMTDFIKGKLRDGVQMAERSLKMTKDEAEKTETAINRLKRKDGADNPILTALHAKHEQAKINVSRHEHAVKMMGLALKEVDNYSYLTDAKPKHGTTTSSWFPVNAFERNANPW